MDSKTLSLFQKIIVGVIAAIALYFYISIMRNTEEADGSIDGMLRFTYVVLALALIASVIVWLKDIITNPKKLMQTLVFVGLFALVVLIAKYVLASNEPVDYYPNIHVDANTSNWVDTGLYTFYILGFIAIALMFLSPVLSLIGSGGSSSSSAVEESDEVEEDEEA